MPMESKNPEYGVQEAIPKINHEFIPGPWARCEARVNEEDHRSRMCGDFYKDHETVKNQKTTTLLEELRNHFRNAPDTDTNDHYIKEITDLLSDE